MFYSLDRFEENFAVFVDDDKNNILIEVKKIPIGAKAGDVFLFENEKLIFDSVETIKRKNNVNYFHKKLLHKKKKKN